MKPTYSISDNVLENSRLAFSVRETSKILGVSEVSVYRAIKRGLLKSSMAFRHKLIPRSEIEKFLNSTLR